MAFAPLPHRAIQPCRGVVDEISGARAACETHENKDCKEKTKLSDAETLFENNLHKV